MGSKELLLSCNGQAFKPCPGLKNFTLLHVDRFRFGMCARDELIRSLANLSDSILLRGHVLLELVEFSLQDFDMLEVVAELLCCNKSLLVVDPEQDFIALPQKLDQNLQNRIFLLKDDILYGVSFKFVSK